MTSGKIIINNWSCFPKNLSWISLRAQSNWSGSVECIGIKVSLATFWWEMQISPHNQLSKFNTQSLHYIIDNDRTPSHTTPLLVILPSLTIFYKINIKNKDNKLKITLRIIQTLFAIYRETTFNTWKTPILTINT